MTEAKKLAKTIMFSPPIRCQYRKGSSLSIAGFDNIRKGASKI